MRFYTRHRVEDCGRKSGAGDREAKVPNGIHRCNQGLCCRTTLFMGKLYIGKAVIALY
jgi:hypothetical protein